MFTFWVYVNKEMESFNNIVISVAKFVIDFFFYSIWVFAIILGSDFNTGVCVFEFDTAAVYVCLNL